MKGMVPDYFNDLQYVKHNQEVLSNMKSGITHYLTSAKQFQLVVAKEVVCMLAYNASIGSSRGVVKVLEVDKQNIRRALER
jgi:hypothetical protein